MRFITNLALVFLFTFTALASEQPPLAPAERQLTNLKTGSMLSDELTFLRRLYLDATGIPPTREQVTAFRENSDIQKYRREIDRVLASDNFTDRWTTFFEDLFQNHDILFVTPGTLSNGFHRLIYDHVARNAGWDELATAILTDTGPVSSQKGAGMFWIKETFEENLRWDVLDDQAAWISQTMLGIRAECISCHDGARIYQVNKGLSQMSRADFWGLAAFLSANYVYEPYDAPQNPEPGFFSNTRVIDTDAPGFNLNGFLLYAGGDSEVYFDDPMFGDGQYHAKSNPGQGMRPPRNGGIIEPRYPFTGETMQAGETRRQALARILTKDRQFARNMVNRIWAHFFGEGFVEPLEAWDLARIDPVTAAANDTTVQVRDRALLEYLTGRFINSGYDIRALIGEILNSRLYQWEYRNMTAEQAANSNLPWSYWRSDKRIRRIEAEAISMSYFRAMGMTPKFLVKDMSERNFHSPWGTPGSSTPDFSGVYDFETGEQVDAIANGFNSEDEMYFFLQIAEQFNRQFGRGNYTFGELRNSDSTIQNNLFLMNDYLTNIYLEEPQYIPTVAFWIEQLEEGNVSNRDFVQYMVADLLFRAPTTEEQQLLEQQLNSAEVEEAVSNIFWALINHADFIHR